MALPSTDPFSTSGDVTRLLRAERWGTNGMLERVVPLLYDELRRVARRSWRASVDRGHYTPRCSFTKRI